MKQRMYKWIRGWWIHLHIYPIVGALRDRTAVYRYSVRTKNRNK